MSDTIGRPPSEPPEPPRRPAYHDVRDDYDDEFRQAQAPAEIARRELQAVAVAFIVAAVVGILAAMVGTVAILVSQWSGAMRSDERLAILIVCIGATWFGAGLFVAVLAAGLNMLRGRRRGLALVAAYVLTGLALAGVYAILFFPIGIWGLVVLYQPDVRNLFDRPVPARDDHARI